MVTWFLFLYCTYKIYSMLHPRFRFETAQGSDPPGTTLLAEYIYKVGTDVTGSKNYGVFWTPCSAITERTYKGYDKLNDLDVGGVQDYR
jgi:hypothetical protein